MSLNISIVLESNTNVISSSLSTSYSLYIPKDFATVKAGKGQGEKAFLFIYFFLTMSQKQKDKGEVKIGSA